MAGSVVALLAPQAGVLVAGAALDVALGDPVYPLHPVRLIGGTLTFIERALRRVGAVGYGGGIVLFAVLAAFWIAVTGAIVWAASSVNVWVGWAAEVYVVYSLLALGDLLAIARRIDAAVAAGDLEGARARVAMLVGRDTDRLDTAACRRAAVESVSENLTDGVTSAVCWYAVLGLPGLVLFKVVSTMDSMVGYKTARYRRFGWCGARLDDVMNFVPARLTWLVMVGVAAIMPGCSAAGAWRVGVDQHRLLPSPNSGWTEAAMAGAVKRRLVGPVWLNGQLVTDLWLGAAGDPPLETGDDVHRALRLATAVGLVFAGLAAVGLWVAGR